MTYSRWQKSLNIIMATGRIYPEWRDGRLSVWSCTDTCVEFKKLIFFINIYKELNKKIVWAIYRVQHAYTFIFRLNNCTIETRTRRSFVPIPSRIFFLKFQFSYYYEWLRNAILIYTFVAVYTLVQKENHLLQFYYSDTFARLWGSSRNDFL